MKGLYNKPEGMKYTDLCIFIDNNFYSEKPDYDTCFKYMGILAVMLATKNKYFVNPKDYEDFAFEMALDTYKRMIDLERTPIKSVLNYMKSVISFRKMAFVDKQVQKILDQEFDKDGDPIQFRENCQISLESSNKEKVLEHICDIVALVPSMIKKSIPKVYKSDKIAYRDIYISSMLTLLNKFTLTEEFKKSLNERLENPTFNESKFYMNHLDDDILLGHLGKSMEAVVRLVVNRVNKFMVDEIKDVSASMRISEEDLNSILFSALGEGEHDDTNF